MTILGIVACWLAIGAAGWAIKAEHGFNDFDQYYRGIAGYLWHERSPYELAPQGYIYPPLMLLFVAPVMRVVDYETAARLWFGSNLLWLALSVLLVERSLHEGKLRAAPWILAALFAPFVDSLASGQVTIVLLAVCTGAWAAYRSGRPVLAGVLVAVAAWIKLYPALLAVYFAWKRDLRATLAAGLAALAMAGVQIAGVGWGVFLEFFRDVLPGLAEKGQYPYYNLSVLGFFQRFAAASPDVQQVPALAPGASLGRWLVCLGLVGIVALLTRGSAADASRERLDAEYSLVLATALLIAPTLWLAGLAPLYLAYAVAFERARRPRAGASAWTFGLSLGLVDVALLQYYGSFEIPWALLSAGMLGALLLWILLARAVRERAAGERATP